MDLPTYAKKRQYMPANMGSGIDANRAPNFPGLENQITSTYHSIREIYMNITENCIAVSTKSQ